MHLASKIINFLVQEQLKPFEAEAFGRNYSLQLSPRLETGGMSFWDFWHNSLTAEQGRAIARAFGKWQSTSTLR